MPHPDGRSAAFPHAFGSNRLPAHAWAAIAVVGLSLVYAAIEVTLTRPYLWPAGTGAVIAGDPASRLPLVARPPDLRTERARDPAIESHRRRTARQRERGSDPRCASSAPRWRIAGPSTFVDPPPGDAAARIEAWRGRYWLGVTRTSDDAPCATRPARGVTSSVARPGGVAGNAPGWRAEPPRDDHPGRRVRRRRTRPAAAAPRRPDGGPERCGAGAERRRQRRTAARRRGHVSARRGS